MTLAQAYKKQFGKVSYPFEIFDANGRKTYHEGSDGYCWKREYDADGNKTYYEDSDGFREKIQYGANGNRKYYENSDGYWKKYEYDANGKLKYVEDSKGVLLDERKSSCDGKIVEIDGKKYKLKEL